MSKEYIIENLGDEAIVNELTVFPESSVLAGQEQKVHVEPFDTVEEAQKAYPKATVVEGFYRCSTRPLGDCPEPWFDTANAGEEW